MSLVIDASVVASWAFSDERSSTSLVVLRRIGRGGATVPAIWTFEVANLLLNGQRQGRLARGERDAFIQRLTVLPIQIDPGPTRLITEVLAIADTHSLTAYDAAYLELASRLNIPLVSKDLALVNAAARIGVELIPA